MNEYDSFDAEGTASFGSHPPTANGFEGWDEPNHSSWFETLRQLWHWNDLAAEIGQESQARVAFVGLAGAGKSLLFNRLRGWTISGDPEPALIEAYELHEGFHVELLGVFVLSDLPPHPPALWATQELLPSLGDPALVVYLIDGEKGVSPADFRWIAALRAAGRPLLAVLNKCDLLNDIPATVAEATTKLGMPVVPISANTGQNISEQLLPSMLDRVPRLAVPLGRELSALREQASRRVIRQASLLAGVAGVQPIPLLDLPFQVMIQVGVVMRVGAAYGYAPTGGVTREIAGTVLSTLGIRYAALALVKMIPFVGWAVAGFLSSGMTLLFGEAAIRYYESGAKLPLGQQIVWPHSLLPGKQQKQEPSVSKRPFWRRAKRSQQETTQQMDEIIEVQDGQQTTAEE
ncbi:MAG: DUF697 domain-containing protein [Ardenticatenaceae bacterium]|nr:DUF697 domain-containing protein [Anaerolineales bacterium]MCB9005929.1 DUF697 domain-containing protein [Ardenticatenaceae bacterium]